MTHPQTQQPLEFRKNQYRGPNAHLLSLQQTPRSNVGLWKSFHNGYIYSITAALNRQLPKGYIAVNEKSLQIQITDELTGTVLDEPYAYPDSAVFDKQKRDPADVKGPALVDAPTWIIPVTLREPEDMAVVIHTVRPNAELGEALARIELLSPSNKTGAGLEAYLENRVGAFASGTILYEIDLLHEMPTIFRHPRDRRVRIPLYPTEDGSRPYLIAVTDPLQEPLTTQTIGFNVDDPFPAINIVLRGQVVIEKFDLGEPYNQTFEGLRCGDLIDYRFYPDPKREQELGYSALEKYSAADRRRIEQRMALIAALSAQGVDLDREGPFPPGDHVP